jgi:hypothetical protein
MILFIQNDEQKIEKTSYWESDFAENGLIFMSMNAGAFRLLLPPGLATEIVTEAKKATEVLISRGTYKDKDAVEILFEDGTKTPFVIHMGVNQVDMLPPDDDAKERVITLWTDGPKLEVSLPAFYRRVPKLPWLKPRP